MRLGRLLTLISLAAFSLSPGFANEPDGRAALRYHWSAAPGGRGGARILHVSVTASVPLRDLKLSLESTPGLRVTPRGFSGREKALGDLPKDLSTEVEFDVIVPATGGGIASFKVRGTTEDGRPFAEGVGVPVGTPGMTPVIRSGAAEFPAATPSAGGP